MKKKIRQEILFTQVDVIYLAFSFIYTHQVTKVLSIWPRNVIAISTTHFIQHLKKD